MKRFNDRRYIKTIIGNVLPSGRIAIDDSNTAKGERVKFTCNGNPVEDGRAREIIDMYLEGERTFEVKVEGVLYFKLEFEGNTYKITLPTSQEPLSFITRVADNTLEYAEQKAKEIKILENRTAEEKELINKYVKVLQVEETIADENREILLDNTVEALKYLEKTFNLTIYPKVEGVTLAEVSSTGTSGNFQYGIIRMSNIKDRINFIETFTHEYGHFIDHKLSFNKYSEHNQKLIEEITDSLRNQPSCQHLMWINSNGKYKNGKYRLDKTGKYYASKSEIFARLISAIIAHKYNVYRKITLVDYTKEEIESVMPLLKQFKA